MSLKTLAFARRTTALSMSIPTAAKSPRLERQQPQVFLPDELITEILSFLNVKALMRLSCMSKFFNTLISNPTFIKMHLNRSKRNPYLSQFSVHVSNLSIILRSFVFNPFSVRRLLDNNRSIAISLSDDPYHRLDDMDCYLVIGCCNGLFCLLGSSSLHRDDQEFWLYFWNPATRTVSEKLGSFTFINYGWDPYNVSRFDFWDPCTFSRFDFGYDISTDTYKVVAINIWGEEVKEVRVFSLGDNVWRNIQCFPAPLTLDRNCDDNDGVYLNGTLNWLAICGYDIITVEQFVIISLDLGTETYLQLLPPRGFVEVPEIKPYIWVWMDCLCFCHDDLGLDHFFIWQLTEFRVEESWTLFLKISYQNLQMRCFDVSWMHLSENGDTLILATAGEAQVVIYNRRDNRVERTVNIDIEWPFFGEDYVESLVSTC